MPTPRRRPDGLQRRIHGIDVPGVEVDDQTRCGHYGGPTDVIALRFKCCDTWYPCIHCHRALADHEVRVWCIDERAQQAVLCGVCGARLTIDEYLACGSTCPRCTSAFNPGCALHHHLYFETPQSKLGA